QQVQIIGCNIGSMTQVREGILSISHLGIDVSYASKSLASLFQMVVAQVDIGEEAQLRNAFFQQTTADIDIAQFIMSPWILWSHTQHLVQDADRVILLPFTT